MGRKLPTNGLGVGRRSSSSTVFDRSIWEIGDLRSALAEQTTVYAMDRRNHGDSASSEDCRPDAQIADVVAVVESIDDPVHLLGDSSGANCALWAAPQTDNLQSVIPHEPAAPPEADVRAVLKETMEKTIALIEQGQNEEALTMVLNDFVEIAPDELTTIRSSPVWDGHVDTFHRTLLPEAKVAGEFDWWDLTPFEDLSSPTLLPVGSESSHKRMAEQLHEMMPDSRLAILEGYGHFVHLVAPDRYTDVVLSFINEID